jgi:uncharacterized cupredoxin-like copper-binding protein
MALWPKCTRTTCGVRSVSVMKILLPTIVVAVMSVGVVLAQEGPAEKAKDVATDTAEAAKDVAKSTAKGVKKAVKEVTGEATAHRVNVTMTEYHFAMPSTVSSGLTTFVIKNAGQKEHAFEIKGEGIDRRLSPSPKPGETARLEVNLKPGTYTITCPLDFHTLRGMKTTLTVK